MWEYNEVGREVFENRHPELSLANHCPRRAGRSGYTLSKLVGLWLNMLMGFSVAPLRLGLAAGSTACACGVLLLAAVFGSPSWLDSQVAAGSRGVLACVALLVGAQLIILALMGEYVGRVFLQLNGPPQYVVRYVRRRKTDDDAPGDTLPSLA